MKIEVEISELTHEDIVNLFSAATYGNDWLGISIPKEYREAPYLKDIETLENKYAAILLHDGQLHACDYYAEDADDVFGDILAYKYDRRSGCMKYSFNLADVEKGLEKAFKDSCAREYVMHLMDEPEQLDLNEADILMQYIMFGEQIYG